MITQRVTELIGNKLLESIVKYRTDPEYRLECKRKQEREIAFIELQKLLWAIDGTVKNIYAVDMMPYKDMTTEELRKSYAILYCKAMNKPPKYSICDLCKSLSGKRLVKKAKRGMAKKSK